MRYKLGDIAPVQQGLVSTSDRYWLLNLDMVESNTGKIIDYLYVEEDKIGASTIKFDENNVLYSKLRPYLNKVVLPNTNGYATSEMLPLRPNTEIITREYLTYFLRSRTFVEYINEKTSGAKMPRANISDLKGVEIDCPSLEKQIRITTQIDNISSIINKRKAELDELDNLIKSRFVEMFGERGKVVPLTDYVWFQEGPGVRTVDFTTEGTILLTGSNINDNQISFGHKSDRFISDELANGKYAHFMCDKDDIIVVSSAIAPEKFDKKVTTVEEDKKYCLNTGIIRFKPNKEVMTLGYFREFLKTDYFKHQVMAEMRGIAQMHFGPSHLKQMTILLPESMKLQIEFETFVNQVDKLKFEVQKSLDETKILMDSLMQQYFG